MTCRVQACIIPLVLVTAVALGAAQESPSVGKKSLRLQVPGSSLYAGPVDVPVRSAALVLDSLNFDGKKSLFHLHKGQTTMYLVFSNLEVGCELSDVYDRDDFLVHNGPKLEPKLPNLRDQKDWISVISYQQHYDPRKVSGPPLATALTATANMDDFFGVRPWNLLENARTKREPATGPPHGAAANAFHWTGSSPSAFHFGIVSALLFSPAVPEGPRKPKHEAMSVSWTYDNDEVFLDMPHKLPVDPLVLRRDGKDWVASINITTKLFSLTGTVPVQTCAPNVTEVN